METQMMATGVIPLVLSNPDIDALAPLLQSVPLIAEMDISFRPLKVAMTETS